MQEELNNALVHGTQTVGEVRPPILVSYEVPALRKSPSRRPGLGSLMLVKLPIV